MKLSDLLQDEPPALAVNGHRPPTNGAHSNGALAAPPHSRDVARVQLPGSTLFPDSQLDRQEFVRLVMHVLRDVGYTTSAATLEAESGYTLESPQVASFRIFVLSGDWERASDTVDALEIVDVEDRRAARFMLSQQKYLELLEAKDVAPALHVLRSELAPHCTDPTRLHLLSTLMMCASSEELHDSAGWDGANGNSRKQLLGHLHTYIPAAVMLPARRLPALLDQARAYQRQGCLYHTLGGAQAHTLFADHACTRVDFPVLTTHILAEHEDEVWQIQWSHDGRRLASASKDRAAIIWRIGPATAPVTRECVAEAVLRDHSDAVGSLAWSLDDSVLLTSYDNVIKMWNAATGVPIRDLKEHSETVSSLVYLPDGTGFVSGGMDRKIVIWDNDGNVRSSWSPSSVRVLDLAVTPDSARLVAVGLLRTTETGSAAASAASLPLPLGVDLSAPTGGGNGAGTTTYGSAATGGHGLPKKRIVVYDLKSRQEQNLIELAGELTSVNVSHDSRYALVNHAPDEVQLWDLQSGRLARKFTGQRQGKHVIRSCFGGVDGNFVLSGSEDGNVYVWHRDTGVLLEVLTGHGEGSVNAVAWHPHEPAVFASCSDDHTIRIWEAPPAGLADFDREREAARHRQRMVAASGSDALDAHTGPLGLGLFGGRSKGKSRER